MIRDSGLLFGPPCIRLQRMRDYHGLSHVIKYQPLPCYDIFVKPKFHLVRHVTSRLDTTRSTCWAHAFWLCQVEQHGSTQLSRRARLARYVERVVSCRDVMSQVEFGLNGVIIIRRVDTAELLVNKTPQMFLSWPCTSLQCDVR